MSADSPSARMTRNLSRTRRLSRWAWHNDHDDRVPAVCALVLPPATLLVYALVTVPVAVPVLALVVALVAAVAWGGWAR